MLRTLSIRRDSFDLAVPFSISRGVKTVPEVVTVGITEGHHVGRGEGVPYLRYGETVDAAIGAIEDIRFAIEGGANRAEIETLLPHGAARNAVDCALWDLEARLSGLAVADFLDVDRTRSVATAITIGLDTPSAMGAAAATLSHVPLLKVKVGRPDAAVQLQAVRNAAPAARMIVDPNESWEMDDVVQLQPLLRALRVDLLEQPLPADQDDRLQGFVPQVPIAADESFHHACDLNRLVGRYQYVNVKLDKTGGLTEALAAVRAARSLGLGVMIGCMICTSLSIAPAMLLATEADFVDLDGPLWLAADRDGGVTAKNGWMAPPQPGFWGEA